jgi:DNA-binding CsgD family transcriptional regulator
MTDEPTLIGRDAELGALTGLLDGLPARGGAITVVGDAGAGKSALLAALAGRASDRGMRVLTIAGVPAEVQRPFGGLEALLRPILDGADGLPDVQRRALMTAFDRDGAAGGRPQQPFLLALATLNLVTEAAAARPVLIAVDDAQWLDQASQEVLAFVGRRVADDPVAVVVAARGGHSGPLLAAGLPVLELGRLDDASAREVLALQASDLVPADRELILRTAEGNPLALIELAVAIRARDGEAEAAAVPLGDRLREAFVERFAELAPAARDVLLVAAVDSTDDLAEILAAASELTGRRADVSTLTPAVTAGLVRLHGPHVVFRNPLTRSGVLQAESLERRRSAHAALASVLDTEPYRRTWHRAQAVSGFDDEVADELEAGHRLAGSALTAISALERSAELTSDPADRVRRLLLAAEQASGIGRADLVDRLVRAATREQLSDLDRARIQWLSEVSDDAPGGTERARRLCDMAETASEAGDTDLALHLLLAAATRCRRSAPDPRIPADIVRIAEGLADAADDPRLIAVLALAEPVRRGQSVAEHLALADAGRPDDPEALSLLGTAALAVGDLVRGAEFLERAETKLREQCCLGSLPQVLGLLSAVRIDLGYWDRVPAAAQEGRRIAEETGRQSWNLQLRVDDARAAGLRGDWEYALASVDELEHTPAIAMRDDLRADSQAARGYALMSAGRHAAAYEVLRTLFDAQGRYYDQRECFGALSLLAEAAVVAQHQDEARSVLAQMEHVGQLTTSPLLHLHLRHARAVLAEDVDAEPLYHAALDADLTAWPWPKARIEFVYGTWLKRQRRVAESREFLRSAILAFDLIGARTWAEQARAELRAAGERPMVTAQPGQAVRDALSAQDLQIARLAAEGLSNREIGARLFMSHRTVGSHLYRIFPKLGITSRSQLAEALRR